MLPVFIHLSIYVADGPTFGLLGWKEGSFKKHMPKVHTPSGSRLILALTTHFLARAAIRWRFFPVASGPRRIAEEAIDHGADETGTVQRNRNQTRDVASRSDFKSAVPREEKGSRSLTYTLSVSPYPSLQTQPMSHGFASSSLRYSPSSYSLPLT